MADALKTHKMYGMNIKNVTYTFMVKQTDVYQKKRSFLPETDVPAVLLSRDAHKRTHTMYEYMYTHTQHTDTKKQRHRSGSDSASVRCVRACVCGCVRGSCLL